MINKVRWSLSVLMAVATLSACDQSTGPARLDMWYCSLEDQDRVSDTALVLVGLREGSPVLRVDFAIDDRVVYSTKDEMPSMYGDVSQDYDYFGFLWDTRHYRDGAHRVAVTVIGNGDDEATCNAVLIVDN